MSHTPGPVEVLARLALCSERYYNDATFGDAVDAVLGVPVYDAAPALLAAGAAACGLLEFGSVREQLKAAIDLAKPPAEKGD